MFGPASHAALVERVAHDMSSAPPAIATSALESARTFAAEVPDLIAELNLPLVAINPDTPATDAKCLTRFGIEVALIPRVGHFPMLEDPLAFNRVLLGALKTLKHGDRPAK
jgi:pimeloyl-ACP methyl ester carboxylesterase